MGMLGQGIVLMVAGMGIVYAFLYIMIIVCEKASRFVSRYDYLVPDEPKKVRKAPAAATAKSSAAPVAAPVTLGRFRLLQSSRPRIVFSKDGLLTAERVPLPTGCTSPSLSEGVKMEEVDPPPQ